MQAALSNQSKQEAKGRAGRTISCGARAVWVKLIVWLALATVTL
jgi:hypothetical protein